MIELSEKDIGKLVSFIYTNREYKKVLITKEKTVDGSYVILLLNNDYPNANTHEDRSIYKYCLQYSTWEQVNMACSNIKYLEEDLTGRYLKALVDNAQCIDELKKGDFVLTTKNNGLILEKSDYKDYIYAPTDIYPNGQKYWELMPIGFKPNKVVDKMQEIQEECKKRFPIGCKFKWKSTIRTLIQDDIVYRINNNSIFASSGLGNLYHNGEYATLIEDEFPEEGCCKYDPRLLQYLKKTRTKNNENDGAYYSWNSKHYYVCNKSSKKEYKIEELEEFLTITDNKWFILCTADNKEELLKYLQSQSASFEGYRSSWGINEGIYYGLPQIRKNSWGSINYSDFATYKFITTPEFRKDILKQNSFEISKWYNYGKLYIKVKKINTNDITGEGIICENFAAMSSWKLKSMAGENCRLLTNLNEIQKFLPESHEDRFPSALDLKGPSSRPSTDIHWKIINNDEIKVNNKIDLSKIITLPKNEINYFQTYKIK